jgi:transcriptional regulator with XRE-family HTH domain
MINRARDITIGKRIAEIRKHREMSLADLAAAIEVSKTTTFRSEHGLRRIAVEEIERLATALHCTVDDLRAPLEAPMPRTNRLVAEPRHRANPAY